MNCLCPLFPSKKAVKSKSIVAAFTLIELLTVIAIIAILAAILIPTVGKVRKQANAATSVSNLRQIGTAMNVWMQDGGMRIPHVMNGRYPTYAGMYGKEGDWARFTWYDLVGEQLGLVERDGAQFIWGVPGHETIFQNPGYDVQFNPKEISSTASYGYNASGLGNYWGHPNVAPKAETPVPALPINIEDPALYVIVAESDGGGQADHQVWPQWAAAGVSDLYNGGGHYLFADGHVEWLEKAVVMEEPQKYFKKIQRPD